MRQLLQVSQAGHCFITVCPTHLHTSLQTATDLRTFVIVKEHTTVIV